MSLTTLPRERRRARSARVFGIEAAWLSPFVERERTPQRDGERGALPLHASHAQVASHPEGEVAADREAEPRAPGAPRVVRPHLDEGLEDRVEPVARNADPRVRDLEVGDVRRSGAVRARRERDDHAPARRRELDRVRQQVEKDLPELLVVRPDARGWADVCRSWSREADLEVDPLLRELRLDQREHVGDDLGDVDRLHVVLDATGAHSGEVQHVVHQPEQMTLRAVDTRQRLALGVGDRTVDAEIDELRVALDRIERGAQLVTHVGEELRLGEVRLHGRRSRQLRIRARAFALVEQPLDLTPCSHLLGDVVAMGGDARPGAVGLDERLIDEVDEPLLGRASWRAREQHRNLVANVRLAGPQHLVEQGEESLVAHLGKRVGDW